MKKIKLLISVSALTSATLAPVLSLASCGSKVTIKAIPEQMLDIKDNVLYGLNKTALLDNYDTLVIPNDVNAIASDAFKDVFTGDDCPIKTIIFNKELKAIGDNAFEGCDSINRIDASNMQDLRLMAMKLGTDSKGSFLSTKNSGGTFVLPDGVTDMQKEWIKKQFTSAGLSGAWFGDKESKDQKVVDELNAILVKSGVEIKTMTGLLAVLLVNEYDLEAMQPASATDQFVWDSKNNKIIVIDQSGVITCSPKDYQAPDKAYLWKMVKPSTTLKLRNKKSSNGNEAYADEFKTDTPYSQYLRSDYDFTSQVLTFKAGIDTGEHTKLELTYTPSSKDDVVPVIYTQQCNLTVQGSTDDIEHYGNLSSLTVGSIGTYSEYGTVDGRIVLSSGKVTVEPKAEVNEILVTSTNVQINVEPSSTIGVVSGSSQDIINKLNDGTIVKPGTGTSTPKVNPTIVDPTAEGEFAAGLGTKESPWCIKTKQQLFKCANVVNSRTSDPSKLNDYLYFKLIGDVDLNNEDWTPIGKSHEHMFCGVFDGNGYTISNLKNHTISGTYSDYNTGGGLFGWTHGIENSVFSGIDSVWDKVEKDVIYENITEDKYTTVIKNVTLENVDIQFTNNDVRLVGGIVGKAIHTYVSNCQVKSGTITATGGVGGIIGSTQGTICKYCVVGDEENSAPLSINSLKKNVAGVVGCSNYMQYPDPATSLGYNDAILNCSTEKNCTVTANNIQQGYVGGILSYAEQAKTMLIDSCVNNAKVESKGTPLEGDASIAGIAAHGLHVDVISNTVNNGEIIVEGSSSIENAAGILTYPGKNNLLYKCINNGKVSARANNYVAGIASGCHIVPVTVETFFIEECKNAETVVLENPLNPQNVKVISDL